MSLLLTGFTGFLLSFPTIAENCQKRDSDKLYKGTGNIDRNPVNPESLRAVFRP